MLRATAAALYQVPAPCSMIARHATGANGKDPIANKHSRQWKVQRKCNALKPRPRIIDCILGRRGMKEAMDFRGSFHSTATPRPPLHIDTRTSAQHRILQHMILQVQRQLNENIRRERPQRFILAKVRFNFDTKAMQLSRLGSEYAPYADKQKLLDTGYRPSDVMIAQLFKDQLVHRLRKYFEARGAELQLVDFERPFALTLQMEWDEEHDGRLATPEDEPLKPPNVHPQYRERLHPGYNGVVRSGR
eukprot:TRINITY_DN36850_c0_g1_i1.p1 TRINITY_DN36850_c0_g1~~TRINITY_DN36850_c0_g1_i1.p1  ORF type:complete len:267 (+),score=57.02 TRINITY_DN36850_c0_g1_i1:62-802(+)